MTSLALLQLVSPALPVGAFSYSEGLEVLIQAGSIADEQAIQAWLEAELQRGAVRLEAAALRPFAEAFGGVVHSGRCGGQGAFDRSGWLAVGHPRSCGAASPAAPDGDVAAAVDV